MHVKGKYIDAVSDAIDFIVHNVDGADEDSNQSETITVLNELLEKMNESRHRSLVSYYVRKKSKRNK